MSQLITDTLAVLSDQAKQYDKCLVAFSGGKDSLTLLDLCTRIFKTVVAFHMYFIPGLKVIEDQMEYARKRWGVEVLMYPHWLLIRCLRNGIFCNEDYKIADTLPEMSLLDTYTWVMQETGIPIMATGAKKADSMWRRRYFYLTRNWDGIFYPLKEWMKRDVLAYLAAHNIPIPDSEGKGANGIDLSESAVLWLHDKYREDYLRLLQWFPYAEAYLKRREFYGQEKSRQA